MSEILFRNFYLLVCCGLLHQLSVKEISVAFCHSVLKIVCSGDSIENCKYFLELKEKFTKPSDTEQVAWEEPIPEKIRGKNLA
jgi:hypothetical protein